MSVISLARRWWPLAGLILITGCTTPQPILDLAGQGAATVGLAEFSLREYLTLTQSQLAARMDLLRIEAQNEVRDRTRREFDLFVARQAGEPVKEDTANLIRVLGDERRRLREKEALELESVAKKSTLDVSTLAQLPIEKLAAAKKSFAVLAQELTPREWVELAVGYAREIKAGVDKLRVSTKAKETGQE